MMTKDKFKEVLQKELYKTAGKSIEQSDNSEIYIALANVLKEIIGENWSLRNQLYNDNNIKQVYYLSMEFLTGKFTRTNLDYINLYNIVEEALDDMNLCLEDIMEEEADPGLGNGGLGRLAAAFLDSLASLSMPGHGYGLRYEKGLFKQIIDGGSQIEEPDNWLSKRNIWEYKRENEEYEVRLGGYIVTTEFEEDLEFTHVNYQRVKAVPYDIPIVGYRNNCVNTLRLWSGESYNDVNFNDFSRGNFNQSYKDINMVNSLTEFLYPDNSTMEGKELRLKQEYLLVSATIQDIVYKYKKRGLSLLDFHKYTAIQINDTHPVLAIPELMRILIDDNELEWDIAWDITVKTFAFTNHTIMWEALEVWDINTFRGILPRIWLITEEINHRINYFLINERDISSQEKLDSMSIIRNDNIHMVNLGVVGSHSINGVAKLHTKILKENTLKQLYEVYPERFNNKTNGIVHRKWLLNANPNLTLMIEDLIGDGFKRDPIQLKNLLKYKDHKDTKSRLDRIKHENKVKLTEHILQTHGIKLNPHSIFDIQIKRIHEYKRQLLNILHIMYLYDKLKDNPNYDMVPRTFIFAGKAAPGYYIAKEIIALINSVASKINNDLTIKDKIKVIFYENYNVSAAELLIPAADVSEQISTAGKEASGTGNMKLMMNGAITLATLDGANVEIKEEVGEENIITFGLTPDEVEEYSKDHSYNAKEIYHTDKLIKHTMDQLLNRRYHTYYEEFHSLFDILYKYNDNYFILKDFHEYRKAQEKIGDLYRDRDKWLEMSLINIAYSGKFSSDYTIKEYAEEIWNIKSVLKEGDNGLSSNKTRVRIRL